MHMSVSSDTSRPAVILIGVCGGIAAYKTVEVVSQLRKAGHDVHVLMTASASRFVTPLTFAAVSGNRVLTESFPEATEASSDALYPHLYPATQADVFVLMPATANMMSCIAEGAGHEIVSMSALSLPPACHRVFCPAMNVEMWQQQSVQDNAARMTERGWMQIGPDEGILACGMEGAGRMAEPSAILEQLSTYLAARDALAGKRVLILSGPTHEYLDPVRYIGNASSGRMGRALAEVAADRGAQVDFVTGPVDESILPRRSAIALQRVVSAESMLAVATAAFAAADIVIFAAAVADYRPKTQLTEKAAKQSGDWALELTATPDIAATLAAQRRADQCLIGFALQTGDGVAEAQAKLSAKQLDGILLNHPEAMGGDSGTYTFIRKDAEPDAWGLLSKRACAAKLWDQVLCHAGGTR